MHSWARQAAPQCLGRVCRPAYGTPPATPTAAQGLSRVAATRVVFDTNVVVFGCSVRRPATGQGLRGLCKANARLRAPPGQLRPRAADCFFSRAPGLSEVSSSRPRAPENLLGDLPARSPRSVVVPDPRRPEGFFPNCRDGSSILLPVSLSCLWPRRRGDLGDRRTRYLLVAPRWPTAIPIVRDQDFPIAARPR